MIVEWKDETSYSRDDVDRTPRTWVSRVGKIRLLITRKWLGPNYGGWTKNWTVEALPFVDSVSKDGDSIEEVKEMAVKAVEQELLKHIQLLEGR